MGFKSLARGMEFNNNDNEWLQHVRKHIENNSETSSPKNLSWSSYHANQLPQSTRPASVTALMPLFNESAHTVAMIKHSMDVISTTVQNLNPGQTTVIAFDQSLFAIAKGIQWKWPEK